MSRHHGPPASKEQRQSLYPPGLRVLGAGEDQTQTCGWWHLFQGLELDISQVVMAAVVLPQKEPHHSCSQVKNQRGMKIWEHNQAKGTRVLPVWCQAPPEHPLAQPLQQTHLWLHGRGYSYLHVTDEGTVTQGGKWFGKSVTTNSNHRIMISKLLNF